jgi:hypothetical protein
MTASSQRVERPWWRRGFDELMVVGPAWLTARALLIAAYVVAVAASERLVDIRPYQLDEGLMAWDGTWYREIAEQGYGGAGDESLRFFPLFPLLGRGLGLVFAGSSSVALVVIANVASIVLLVLVRRLVVVEGHGEAAAQRAVWLTALFPSAFVLAWGYAEALMLVGCVGAFLALRRQQWWWAAAAGLVAGLSRPLGLVLVLPAIVEVLRVWKPMGWRSRAAGAAAIAAPAVGTAAYLLWVRGVYGDAWLPFTVQDEFRGTGTDPFTRMWQGLGDLVGPERFGDGLHVPFAIGFVVLLALTFRWWPMSYGLFAAGVLAASLSADNLNSLERYGLNAFPIVLTLALLARDDRLERPILTISAGGFVALASLAWMGAYVP